MIRADSVRCIGADGEQLGVIPINEALKIAENLSLDLVEIQPNVDPPVCKILDYGEFKYEAQKRKNEARKNPGLVSIQDDFDLNKPQLNVQINQKKATDLGVSTEDIGRTIETIFGSKKVTKVEWQGGKIAETLNSDSVLNELIAQQSINDATITIDPTSKGIRIYGKWKNSFDFKLSKEQFEIFDKIAGHIKSF